MTQVALTLSDSMLAWSHVQGFIAPDQEQVDAWSYSTTKAQMQAREVSADPTSDAYYDAMLEAYQQLGWGVRDLGSYEHAQEPDVLVTPAQVIVEALRSACPRWLRAVFDRAAMPERVWDRLRDPPPHIRALLDWYWGNASVSATVHHMGMGPLISLGAPDILIGVYAFDVEMSSWESLFQPYESASVSAKARLANMRLDMDVYETHKESLRQELAEAASEHIRRTTLDI